MSDEQRIRVKSNAATLVTESALERHSGGQYGTGAAWVRWATGGADYRVTAETALLFKEAYDSAVSDKDRSGNVVSGSRKRNALALVRRWAPNLTARQLLYLESFYWTPDTVKLKALKENGYRKSGTA